MEQTVYIYETEQRLAPGWHEGTVNNWQPTTAGNCYPGFELSASSLRAGRSQLSSGPEGGRNGFGRLPSCQDCPRF